MNEKVMLYETNEKKVCVRVCLEAGIDTQT